MDSGNKRLALLVGCSYPNTPFTLHGCINDVMDMQDLLVKNFGFDTNHIRLLVDAPESKELPTGANITAALKNMVEEAKPGDVLFFHFSGHGTTIPSLTPSQPFMLDEAIVPCDLNLITDLDLRQFIKRLPIGSSFTILSDSCHSGGLIDKDKEQIGPTVKKLSKSVHHRAKHISAKTIHECLEAVETIVHGAAQLAQALPMPSIGSMLSGIFGKDVSIKFQPHLSRDLLKSLTEDEGILLSGCQANETSADVDAIEGRGKAYGAFTNAVLQVINESKGSLSNRELVTKVRRRLEDYGFGQHACLYCSDENADAFFLGKQYSLSEPLMAAPAHEPWSPNHLEAVEN